MPPNRLKGPPDPGDGIILLSRLFLNQYQMRLVTLFGGEPGLERPERLEAVMQEARAAAGEGLRGDVLEVAAVYAIGLSGGAFRGGNLRLAAVAMGTLIRLNGFEFSPSTQELVETMKAVAAGTIDRPDLIRWLRTHSRRLEPAITPAPTP